MLITFILKGSELRLVRESSQIQQVVVKSPLRTIIEFGVGRRRERLIVPCSVDKAMALINGTEQWQDDDRCWREVDRVYETRWDCQPMPEGVRRAA